LPRDLIQRKKIKKWNGEMENSKVANQALSKNFNLDEFIISQTAERFGYDNTPTEQFISNLRELCINVLQPLHEIIKVPVIISSGYRCYLVNTAIGGGNNSQHMEGKAADVLTPNKHLYDTFNVIYKNLPFDQLIFEFEKWIHVSYNGTENRKQAMISKRVSGKVVYELVYKELRD